MGKKKDKNKLKTFTPYCESLPDPVVLMVLKNRRKNKWYQVWKQRQRDYFQVWQTFTVKVNDYDHFVVPEGFKTDLASIPRVLQNMISVIDSHILGAIVHDYLYREPIQIWRGRKFADDMFLRIMQETNVPNKDSKPIYWAVKMFGGSSYQKSKRGKAKKSLQSKKI